MFKIIKYFILLSLVVAVFLVMPVKGGSGFVLRGFVFSKAHALGFEEIYEQFQSEPLPVVGCTATYKDGEPDISPPHFGVIESRKSGGCRTIDVITRYGGNTHVNSLTSPSCQRGEGLYFSESFLTGYLLIVEWSPDDQESRVIYSLYHDSEKTFSVALIDYKQGSPENIKAIEFARSIGVGNSLVRDVIQKTAEIAGFDIDGVYGRLMKEGAEVLMEKSPRRK